MNRFCQFPNCKEFSLSEGANVQLVIRRHWIMDFIIALQYFFWGPFLASLVFFSFPYIEVEYGSNTFFIASSISVLYMITVTFYFFFKWLNHVFDIIFLTTDRVIDVTQVDFWHRNISETRLDHVQDATGDVKGILYTIFDWGTIKIRTSNDIADFSINVVQHPHKKAREVFRLANSARRKEISGGEKIDLLTKAKRENIGKEGTQKKNVNTENRGNDNRYSEKKINTPEIIHHSQKVPKTLSSLKKSVKKNNKNNKYTYDTIKKSMRHDINSLMSKK